MDALYIAETKTEIRRKRDRYTHPETGEVYGGTDYLDPIKLAEMGAVSLRDEAPAEGMIADGWEIVNDGDGFVRRPTSQSPIPEPTAQQELAQLDRVISRDIEDLISVLDPAQQEAYYALTDNAPEGRRRRVAVERKKVIRESLSS